MSVLHQPMDDAHLKVILFNDPIGGKVHDPLPCWPTYEEWIKSGRGDLWKTDKDNSLPGQQDGSPTARSRSPDGPWSGLRTPGQERSSADSARASGIVPDFTSAGRR